VFIFIFILSSEVSAGVIFQDTFDGNLSRWKEHGGCYTYSFAIIQDPCSDSMNNRVIQITNRMGEDNRVCHKAPWNKSLPKSNNAYKHRAELMPSDGATRVEPRQDFWVGMRTFIPKTYPSSSPLIHFHVSQIIPPPHDGTDMSLQINTKGAWVFSIRRTPAKASRHDQHVNLGPIARGKWTNWVIHYKRSTKKDGIAQVWQDDKLVVDYQGVTSQSEEAGGLWKLGLYRGALVQSKHFGEEYKIYFDDVKVAKGSKQYEAVRPNKAASKCVDSPLASQSKSPEQLRVEQLPKEQNKD
jgi:hypothetical protein